MTPKASETALTGMVERITFHSEDTGFGVLKVKVRGHADLVTVVGTLPAVTAGEWLEAKGAWVVDPKHGQQFRAQHLHTTNPDTIEGIEKYLGSGLIKGIGPVYASKLVRAFGKNVFDVIENSSALLQRVEGIGPVRRATIKAAWNEQKAVRAIMTFLLSHGVGTTRAFRIYKTYGDGAIEKIRADPYCLARDIRGIGFQSADQIAMRLNVPKDSELRARAGVEHVLQALTDNGHCAYPRAALVEQAGELLEIPVPVIQAAIDKSLADGRLVAHREIVGDELIYLAALDRAENGLAQELLDLSRGSHPCPPLDVPKALAWVQDRIRLELAPSQRDALATALTSKVMVITGGPGVGKTTLVNAIVKVLKAKDLHVRLCAPTGRAAKRMSETSGMEATTIHRLLEYDPGTGEFRHNQAHPLAGDVFIVDETSMIDIVLAYQFVRAIPSRSALVMVGDVDQLPSVGPGCVLRDIIECGLFPVCRLTHIFRQAASSAIITNAHRINEGKMPLFPAHKAETAPGTDFFFIESDEPPKAVELVIRLVRESLPRKFGLRAETDIQVLTPMQRGELGARNLNLVLQAALNPAGPSVERFGWTYRVGDKVMQLQNDYDKDVYNGDIGRIAEIDEAERELTVRFDNREVLYDLQEIDELALSYAITIHKSQGSEYPCVVVPIHTQHYVLLQRNLLYTAVTRGRRLVVLVGSAKALGMAVNRLESTRRITTLRERLLGIAGQR